LYKCWKLAEKILPPVELLKVQPCVLNLVENNNLSLMIYSFKKYFLGGSQFLLRTLSALFITACSVTKKITRAS
jgi:hypothetical protein